MRADRRIAARNASRHGAPVSAGKRVIRQVLSNLRDARESATLKHMDVGNCTAQSLAPVKMRDGTLVTEYNVSDFIRERLELYNHLWVIYPLDLAIEALEESIK